MSSHPSEQPNPTTGAPKTTSQSTSLDDRYLVENFPVDTADDDPRWAGILDLFSTVFLDPMPGDGTLTRYRDNWRALTNPEITTVSTRSSTDLGNGADNPSATTASSSTANAIQDYISNPIAVFSTSVSEHNAGTGLVPTAVINTIGVRSTHRRQGIMRSLMTSRLQSFKDSGIATAVLTASDAQLYGRFGFAPTMRSQRVSVKVRDFAFRPDVEVAPGRVEMCKPAALERDYDRIALAFDASHRGAHAHEQRHRSHHLALFNGDDNTPAKDVRALAYFAGPNEPKPGQVQGFVTYKATTPTGHQWPDNLDIVALCAPTPAIERRLWQELASIELIETITQPNAPLSGSVHLALKDIRAWQEKDVEDSIWLRILDVQRALSQRGYDADGTTTLRITDELGLTAGTFHLDVRAGRAQVEEIAEAPAAVTLDVTTLARVYFGDRTLAECSQAGLVSGQPADIAEASRIFATALLPVSLAYF